MDFQAFLDMLSGRPANANAGTGAVERGRQAQESRQAQELRQGDRKLYRSRIEAANLGAPAAPPSDLFGILMANQGQGAGAPELSAFREAGQEHVAQAEDMFANAQSNVAAAEMQPPLSTIAPQEVVRNGPPMWGFQPETASAAPPQAGPQKSIEFLGLPPATPRPPPPGPMPAMEQMSKPTPFIPDFNRISPVGPSVAGQDFIPMEVLQASRQPQPIAPLRPAPQGPVIGPGGAGAELPFAPTIRAGAPAPAEPQAIIPGIQRNGWISPPQGAPPMAPRQMPPQAPAQPEVSADELNRQELQRLLSSFDQPPASAPPPAEAAPSPTPPATVADTSNQNKNVGALKMNQAMPQILKDQLLLEAQRLTRNKRQGAA